MTVLVIGASGYLGSELAARAPVTGTSTTGAGGWLRLDVTDRSATRQLLASVRPKVVINTAAKTTEWAVTADGAANVALAAAAVGARLVHMSTDALHAGRPSPYLDDEDPTPVHMYGAAKAAAETAVAAIMPSAAIVRTSLIIGNDRSKQVELILGMARRRTPGALFTDEFRRPVAVQDLAAAVLELAESGFAGRINVAGPQTVSRAELGRMVASAHGLDPDSVPTSSSAAAGLGPRPANVVLDSSYAQSLLRTTLRPASECVAPL